MARRLIVNLWLLWPLLCNHQLMAAPSIHGLNHAGITISSNQTDTRGYQIDTRDKESDVNSHEIDVNRHQIETSSHKIEVSIHQTDTRGIQIDSNSRETDVNSQETDVNSHQTVIRGNQIDTNIHKTAINSPETDVNSHQTGVNHREHQSPHPFEFHRDKRNDVIVTPEGRGSTRAVGVALWSGWDGSSLRIHPCIDERCNGSETISIDGNSKNVGATGAINTEAKATDESATNRKKSETKETDDGGKRKPPLSTGIQHTPNTFDHKVLDTLLKSKSNGKFEASSKDYCLAYLEDNQRLQDTSSRQQIYASNVTSKDKGIVMQVINQRNAKIIMQKVFPLGEYWAHWLDLEWHLNRINTGRIVALSVSGFGCIGLRGAAEQFAQLGSMFALHLTMSAHWNWIFIKGGKTISETASLHAPVNNNVHVRIPLKRQTLLKSSKGNSLETAHSQYCESEGGMGDLCDEESPAYLPPKHGHSLETNENSVLANVPVVVTAGKRHQYLYNTLMSLLTAQGSHPENIIVILGDTIKATMDLLCLLGIRFVSLPIEGKGNKKLFRYYRNVYDYVAKTYSTAPAAIFLDEDVQVSPDFFSYMSKTMWLLYKDPTIYCINGFSATGFSGLAHDPTTVLRARTQVEWGYAITLDFIREALSKWPINPEESTTLFYDEWLYRYASGDRECIFPEMSRTYHFGMGINTNGFSAEAYFLSMPLVKQSNIPLHDLDGLILPEYNQILETRIRNAMPLKGSPCSKDFIPVTTHPTDFVFYYSMESDANGRPIFQNFFYSAKCLNAWALSDQGQHDMVLTVRTSPTTTIFLVGAPFSPFGHLCPESVKPWRFESLTDDQYDELIERIKNFELGNYKIPNVHITSDKLIEILTGNKINDAFQKVS